jgi:alpha-N-arabinofuranosidase
MLGNPKMVVDGGIDPSKKPIWIEGPHIYKRSGKYYLMAAEGGTSVNHSEVILRADRVDGPYTPRRPRRTRS